MRLAGAGRALVFGLVVGGWWFSEAIGHAEEGDDIAPGVTVDGNGGVKSKDSDGESAEPKKPAKTKKSKKSEVVQMSDDSASNRQTKMAGIDVGFGMTIGGLPGLNLHGYYNLNADFSLGLMYSSGELDLTSALTETAGISITEAKVSGSIIGLAARYFTGNSFYLLGGIGQRSIDMGVGIKSTTLDYGIEGNVEASSTVVVLSIGNQWQWSSGFSLGVEWFGYASAFGAEATSSFSETGALASTVSGSTKEDMEKLRKDAQEAGELIGQSGSIRLFVISLGFAF